MFYERPLNLDCYKFYETLITFDKITNNYLNCIKKLKKTINL